MEPHGAALVSGEGVRLSLTTAGLNSRVIAAAIDLALQLIVLVIVVLVTVLGFGNSDAASLAAVNVVETVLIIAGYPILMEWLTRGRTLGKLALGLRVVRDDGGPIGFRQALVRGLAGLVLEKPGFLFPGVLAIFFSPREKRIGDMMAGTIVLNERSVPSQTWPPAFWVPPALLPWAAVLDLTRLDDGLAWRVRQFLVRAYELTPSAQHALGERLRELVLAVISPPPPWDAPTPAVLNTVLAERRRRAAMPVRHERGYPATPGPPQAPSSPPAQTSGTFAPPR